MKLITNAKYGNKEILPELHVIQEGSLSGFISINPRWSGFKARDYFEASQSVLKPANMNVPDTITASAGSFDLRDYEVARGQFFSSVGRISVSFSYPEDLNVSSICCLFKISITDESIMYNLFAYSNSISFL